MRISDWSSDVCSSDLRIGFRPLGESRLRRLVVRRAAAAVPQDRELRTGLRAAGCAVSRQGRPAQYRATAFLQSAERSIPRRGTPGRTAAQQRFQRRAAGRLRRSEEHTSELKSLMRTAYDVICLKKENNNINKKH